MRCPRCGVRVGGKYGRRLDHFETQGARYPETRNIIVRRYRCRHCDFRFTTDELIRYTPPDGGRTKFGDWVIGVKGKKAFPIRGTGTSLSSQYRYARARRQEDEEE